MKRRSREYTGEPSFVTREGFERWQAEQPDFFERFPVSHTIGELAGFVAERREAVAAAKAEYLTYVKVLKRVDELRKILMGLTVWPGPADAEDLLILLLRSQGRHEEADSWLQGESPPSQEPGAAKPHQLDLFPAD